MRWVNFDILWKCILSSYSKLVDIEIFDTAVNDSVICCILALPLPSSSIVEG
jgi:hypothetical protein